MATLDWANARAIVRAHRDFARMRDTYTDHPDRDLIAGGRNILADYYLRRHTTYGRL